MVDFIFILLLVLVIFTILIFFSKNTIFEFNPKKGLIWVTLLYQSYILICLPLLLLNIYGADYFSDVLVFVENKDVFWISLVSLYAVFSFTLTILVFSRFIKFPSDILARRKVVDKIQLEKFVNSTIFCAFAIFLFSYLFLGYKHAFIEAILTGQNVLDIRLNNVYQSNLPSQLAYLIYLSYIISSIFAGILLAGKNYLKFLLYMAITLFLASVSGQKAPVFTAITISMLSYISIVGFTVSVKKTLFSVLIYFPLLYLFLFSIVSLQIDDLDFLTFNAYLLGRLGVGQMAGVFESLSIPRIDGDFYLHIIPFSRAFIDYIPYDKALMMYTEGYRFDEMGVKNSLFISEAYGIGGWALLIASPFIVGVSFILGIKILYLFFKNFFDESVAIIFAFPIFILTANLTSGFSSFPLFKGLIQVFILFLFVWMIYYISMRISFLRKN